MSDSYLGRLLQGWLRPKPPEPDEDNLDALQARYQANRMAGSGDIENLAEQYGLAASRVATGADPRTRFPLLSKSLGEEEDDEALARR